jgi:hypothetical protein
MRALRGRISHAAMYLAGTLTLGLGINRIQLWFRASGILLGFYQIVCTFAGVLSGAAPLLTLLVSTLALLCFGLFCFLSSLFSVFFVLSSLFCPLQK